MRADFSHKSYSTSHVSGYPLRDEKYESLEISVTHPSPQKLEDT
jgi:hypothetical protein